MKAELGVSDVVLDTGALADVLVQFIQSQVQSPPRFVQSQYISYEVARLLNRVVRSEGRFVVVASALAFVEMAHQWERIIADRINPVQLAAFLNDPPEWFAVAPVDQDLVPFFMDVSPAVTMPWGRVEPVEWTDAVHAATALSRDNAVLVSSDRRLKRLPGVRVVYSRS